jgi:hypothetical protein
MPNDIPPPDPRSARLLQIRSFELPADSKANGSGENTRSLRRNAPREGDWSWEEPDRSLLEDRRGEVPQFPVDALGPSVAPLIERVAKGAGVTSAHVVVPLLSIASSLIGAARQVKASSAWYEPLSLWTAVIGFSGTGKTPGLEVSRRTLGAIEKLRKESIDDLRRDHEQRAAVAKAAAKKWRGEVEKALENDQPPPQRPQEAEDLGPFVAPQFHVSDTTIEKLAVLLKARARGMLVIYDELSGLFANMARYSRGSDRAFWLQCWNGGRYIVERLNRPSVTVDHLLVGLTGGFQPDKLDGAFAGDDDGMYARMLYCWPDESPYRPLTNEASFVEPQLQEALTRLINLQAGDGTQLEPQFLALSEEAQLAFEEFRKFQHELRSRLEGREQEWWAKAQSHVLRLAGTLAYLDWSMRGAGDPAYEFRDDPQFQVILRNAQEPSQIDELYMRRAIDMMRGYFWPHAQACLRQMGMSEQHRLERRVLRWLRVERSVEVSREQVRRDALARKFDAERVQTVLDRLVALGWLREREVPSGGRTSRRWDVNPILFA